MSQERKRGFEVIQAYQAQNIELPQRATTHAAGYDIAAAEDVVLPSFYKQIFKHVALELKQWIHGSGQDTSRATEAEILQPTLVPTGLKAYMQEDEYLQIVNRSSNPLKRRLMLPNGFGVIDADYYNNPSNEGHIYVQLINFGLSDYTIRKGDRIAQGIFVPFLLIDGDEGGQAVRSGGFGSSDDNNHLQEEA
ncbi:dUTP diphosphatase [Suicoccus acidiformans]|uniref:dUTP diphosphatase n=1 Tax=Suicoccus acidiformans TaxID=2036206 RepID=A0A347WNK6_9LACT|nr:dUTP diphosphatase [Suicoccus acidiformans]AXY26663.1 dUTP diphosphatase [Suicoccus acidiformans]